VGPLAPIKGASLTLYFELPELGMSYDQLLWEMAREGFTHVTLVTQWAQGDIRSSSISAEHPEASPAELVRRVIRRAHALKLKVLLFPILWVELRSEGEWRGALKPREPERWWARYQGLMVEHARLAAEEQVWGLSVGSELSSLEGEEARWRALIKSIRARFSGLLTYSANWDHYDQVPFWDALDLIGISAYYELASSPESEGEELRRSWAQVRWALHDWYERSGLKAPLFFTELGYPSHAEGAMRPWHDQASQVVDLEVQRAAFSAFREAWREDSMLLGASLWTWWGLGGPHDAWYTLRGKPVMSEVRAWLHSSSELPAEREPLH